MAIEYFCCYHSYFEIIEQLNDAEKGRLFTACLTYSKTGEVPQLGGNERFVFPTFKAQIDRDNAKYEEKCRKQSENAKKRWDATACHGMPTHANACQRMPTDAKHAKEKEKAKTKENAKGKEKNPPLPPLEWAGEELRTAFSEWLAYKSERLEAYQPTGLKCLEAEIRSNAEKYGEAAVAALIRQCMASGWRGIIFERLAQGKSVPGNSTTAPSQWAIDAVARLMKNQAGNA